jgi:flagellar basal-body rod protein FlgB
MVMLNKLDAALSFHQNALRVRGQRQELIAANIANADTPNYKARDIDFNAVMKNAVANINDQQFQNAQSLEKTSGLHLNGIRQNSTSTNNISAQTMFRPIVQGSVDGNTVDMDVERNQFADNAIRYEASLTMLNNELKKMTAALQSS